MAVGFSRLLGVGMQRAELLHTLAGWRLLALDRVPGEQMYQYVRSPAPLRAALRRGAFPPLRHELEYAPA